MTDYEPFHVYGPHKKKTSPLKAVVGLLGAMILAFVSAFLVVAAFAGPSQPSAPESHVVFASEPPPSSPRPGEIRAGTWAVGDDVPAGTYTTTAPAGEHCYWARLSDFEGNGGKSIIDNGLLENAGRGRIVLKKSDAGVEFRGPCVWRKIK